MSLKKIKIIAVIGLFILSFPLHFLYDWLPNSFIAIFVPINESIWEHMKILYTATLLYGLIDYYLLKKNNINFNNFRFQLFFTSFISIIIYLIIYLPLYSIFKENMFISISLLVIVYSIIQIISYYILQAKENSLLNNLAIVFIIIMYIIFAYLTFNPLDNYLFVDFS